MIESTSVDVTGLNRAAARLLRREDSLTVRSLPPLLQLARWGMDNLDLEGPWEEERETLEMLLLRLERIAIKEPVAAVAAPAVIDDPETALQPEQLGPTLEDAAALVLEQMYFKIAEPIPD